MPGMETTAVTNGEIRKMRLASEITQGQLADALAISKSAYRLFELYYAPLPRGLTPSDAIDAINRLAAQKQQK